MSVMADEVGMDGDTAMETLAALEDQLAGTATGAIAVASVGAHPLPSGCELAAVKGVLLVGDNADDVSVWLKAVSACRGRGEGGWGRLLGQCLCGLCRGGRGAPVRR